MAGERLPGEAPLGEAAIDGAIEVFIFGPPKDGGPPGLGIEPEGMTGLEGGVELAGGGRWEGVEGAGLLLPGVEAPPLTEIAEDGCCWEPAEAVLCYF